MIGNKHEQALPLIYYMAARGWIVVAINYRLSPGFRFPAHLLDCKRALAWIRDNIASYGGDPGFVAVTGGSAGGHLAALLALTANERSLQPGFEHADTRVTACVPFYGVYDFADRNKLRRDGGKMTRWLARNVMEHPLAQDPRGWDLASPIAQVSAAAPPFFVLHGTHDSMSMVEEARVFVQRLRAVSRKPVVYGELPGAQHAWEIFRSVRALHTIHAVARFLEWTHASTRKGSDPR
jgi:acetyl esterase/lipase